SHHPIDSSTTRSHRMKDVTIITTTINDPRNLAMFAMTARRDGVNLSIVVAGDQKSPHVAIRNTLRECFDYGAGVTYLHPDMQEEWSCSDLIGWNNIQRRNIAILEAVRQGAEWILTVDDDNWPKSNYWDSLIRIMGDDERQVIHSRDGWYNPGWHCRPGVIHRGFPLSQWNNDPDAWHETMEPANMLGVAAGLWYGEPDVDAITRIAKPTTVYDMDEIGMGGFVVAPGVMAPINTQNTLFTRYLAPTMHCFVDVGRHDDIVGSYLTKIVADHYGYDVHYGPPFVEQDRNPHDLFKDLKQEMWGYENIEQCVVAFQRGWEVTHSGASLDERLRIMVKWLLEEENKHNVLSKRSLECYDAYLDDMRKAVLG